VCVRTHVCVAAQRMLPGEVQVSRSRKVKQSSKDFVCVRCTHACVCDSTAHAPLTGLGTLIERSPPPGGFSICYVTAASRREISYTRLLIREHSK